MLRIESFEPIVPFTSNNTKKYGRKRNKQNYFGNECKRQFVGGTRLNNARLWCEYTVGKQSYKQLAERYSCSIRTIQRRLDSVQFGHAKSTVKKAYVVMDTTYFGRHFGLMVFMDNSTRSILHYDFVRYKTNALYIHGIRVIKENGVIIQSVTCDGRRGLIGSFGVATQMCQFHQLQIITRYLTRKPQHAASQALRNIAIHLPKTTKADFEKCWMSGIFCTVNI